MELQMQIHLAQRGSQKTIQHTLNPLLCISYENLSKLELDESRVAAREVSSSDLLSAKIKLLCC